MKIVLYAGTDSPNLWLATSRGCRRHAAGTAPPYDRVMKYFALTAQLPVPKRVFVLT